MTVGHNPPVSGVAAFGSQDLSFRTSIFGYQDLGFRISGVAAFGSQDLGFKTSTNGRWVSLSGPGFQDLESSPSYGRLIFFPSLFSASTVIFLCVQWSQTHGRTDATSDFLYKMDCDDIRNDVIMCDYMLDASSIMH